MGIGNITIDRNLCSAFRCHFCFQLPRLSRSAASCLLAWLTMAANGFELAATVHQPGSPAATCHQPCSPEATCPPRASDFQPDDTDVQEPLRQLAAENLTHAATCPPAAAALPNDDWADRRARAVAACGAAVADLAFRLPVVPQLIKDMGGYNAPVVVTNLVVADVYPGTLRYTVPSARRVAEELHNLVRALPGERARLLVKMAYWPKLLEAVVVQEKNDEKLERARLRRQRDKQLKVSAPAAVVPLEPEDVATSPYEAYEAVEAPSPDVGGNESEEQRPELKRTKRARFNNKQHTAGSASASSAPSASCAAAATKDDIE